MRILHALVPAPFGGLERVVQMLAIAQREAGQAVGVAAIVEPGMADHPFFDPLKEASVPCYPVEVRPRAYATERRLLRHAFKDVGPDLVHTHGYRADVIAGAAARGSGLPIVSTAHGFTGGGGKNRFFERLQVRAYRRWGHVVAVSEPLRLRLLASGVPEPRLHLVRNGWLEGAAPLGRAEARSRLGLSSDAFTVGWVGRIGFEKGPDLAVRALAKTTDSHLSICGEGGERPEIERLVCELGLEERVHWHGRVTDAGRFLRAFDVVLLSSRTEGTPIVVLEAMSTRVPIVATRIGGVPDMIRHEREGLLVPPEDPRAIAVALTSVRSDPEGARRRASDAAVRLEEMFGSGPWVRGYARVYECAGVTPVDDECGNPASPSPIPAPQETRT
jgi:glycosyltransferase involved in cell wall biosynthesis